MLIQRLGIGGELLVGRKAGIDDLLIQIIHRLHDLQAEADNGVPVFGRYRHHALCAKRIAVHDKGLHDLCHGLPLFTV